MSDTDDLGEPDALPESIVQWQPARSPGPFEARAARAHGATATGSAVVGASALGALALGALAIGALAIGRLAIGRVSVKRARFGRLEVDDLVVRRFSVLEPPRGAGRPR